MNKFFARNISTKGRLLRGFIALLLFAGAALAFGYGLSTWLCVLLAASGGFVLFEALRGWCALRACGIKTRL